MDRNHLARAVAATALSAFLIASAARSEEAPGASEAPRADAPRPKAPVAFPFDVGELPAGETLVLEFQASVPAAPVPAGVESVSNQATVSGDGFANVPTDDPDTGAAGDATVTLINAAPDLAVVKTVVDILDDAGASTGQTLVARPGNTIVYQLAWQNKATATQVAAAVALTDSVPTDTTFDGTNSAAGWSCSDGDPAGTACTLSLGDLAPGASGMTAYAVDVLSSGLSGATVITNTATITLPSDDPIPADNSSTVMTSLLNEADIAVGIMLDQAMPIVGESAVFTLQATNNGPEVATNVTILDNINAIGLVSITASVATAGTYTSGTGTWMLPTLGVGATESVDVTVTALAAGAPVSATINASALDQDDPVSANDSGAVDIEPKQADYGDAPDPLTATAGEYPTLLANDGARHAIPTAGATLFLGAAIDGEADGQPDATAEGDDTDAEGDDEDGVTFVTLVKGVAVTVDIEASAAGLLDAWIDFDGDGVFAAGEQIFTDEAVVAGTQTLTSAAVVPLAAVDDTFSRFRLSTAGGTLPTGRADDGEVEDYASAISEQPVITVGDVTVLEGDPGDNQQVVFTVSRSGNANEVTIDVATSNGTATAGSDYIAVALTTLTFPAGGALTQDVAVDILEDNAVEADETLFLDLTNASGAMIGDAQAQGTIENDDFDNTPPTVENLAVVGAGDLPECRTVLGDVSQLAVTFSEPMANAEDPAQYVVLAAGPDADLDTAACGGPPLGDDRNVAILAAVSDGDPSTPTITLDLAGAPRASDPHRLVVCGTLTDEAGNALDGGGGAGTDLVRTFRVDRFNLFANGHFDDCDPADVLPVMTGGWTLTPAMVMAPSRDDVDGAAISGSLVADLADATLASASQAADAAASQRYALRSRIRLVLDAGASVTVTQGCQFFNQPGGVGIALEAVQDSQVLTVSTPGWETRETLFVAPPGSQSVRCAWSAQGLAAGATPPMFELFFDDLSLDVEIFSDGFESTDFSSWSAAVPGGGS